MAGMLTLVNPRRKRARRKKAARKHPRRRRRSGLALARRRNPARRRRMHARRHVRRRRHHNPRIGGGVMGPLMKGAAIGAGVYAVNLATSLLNTHVLKDKAVTGIAATAVKAGVGLIVLPMAMKFIPGAGKFRNAVMLGAGVAVALDLLDTFLTPNLPAALHGYGTEQIQGYGTEQIQGVGYSNTSDMYSGSSGGL